MELIVPAIRSTFHRRSYLPLRQNTLSCSCIVARACRVPSPLPRNTETVWLRPLAVATSSLPSRLKSPVITQTGNDPGKSLQVLNVPSPFPSRIETDLSSGEGEIQTAVAVEVASGYRNRLGSGREVNVGLKRAVTIAEKDRNSTGTEVRHGQVELAVAVEVAVTMPSGMLPARSQRASGRSHLRCQAEQRHSRRCLTLVRHGQVELAIAVEVALARRKSVKCRSEYWC